MKNMTITKRYNIPKILIIIGLILIIVGLSACKSNSSRYETQDINYYFELKETNSFSYRFFPDEIDENTVECFSYIEYTGEIKNTDVLLSLKYLEENEFEEALINFKENVYSEYHVVEKENLFKEGYTSICMVGAKSSSPNPSLKLAWLKVFSNNKDYSCYWDMILYSRTDKVIIFNSLNYQSDIAKDFEHSPYIEDALGVKIKELPTFIANTQEVITNRQKR